jgi:hypothetical protein
MQRQSASTNFVMRSSCESLRRRNQNSTSNDSKVKSG